MIPSRPLRLAALLAFLACVSFACQSEAPTPPTVTVSQLRDTPDEYLGNRVTVEGTVARAFGESAFSIDGASGSVLVVFVAPSAEVQGSQGSGSSRFQAGDAVQVTGRARRFATAVAERDAAQAVNINYEDENPALVANRVVVSPQ